MLLGVVRIGALRQRVEKGIAVLGQSAAANGRDGVTLRPVPSRAGLWSAVLPLTWLGSFDARQQWASGLAGALRATGKATVLPTGIGGRLDGKPFTIGYAEDRHVLEVASAAEQEVLVNLLRQHAAVLIGLAGRSPYGTGSRRLAASREHVTTRYLTSAAPAYLARLEASLRRTEGLAGLDHMDVHPGTEPDGTATVTVRCIDAAASLAATRAHAILLAAFALRAQRLVRDGRRAAEIPHRKVDDDRARAVAHGLRARLHVGVGADRSGPAPASAQLRTLLTEVLGVELDNLGATAEELFPIIAAVDLPGAGLGRYATDDAILGAQAGHAKTFPVTAAGLLLDDKAGGPCLTECRTAAPGRTRLMLDEWSEVIAQRRGADTAPRRAPERRSDRPPGQRGRGAPPAGEGRHDRRGGSGGGR